MRLNFGLFIAVVLSSLFSLAQAATNWNVIPSVSELRFTATQNNSPITGIFKSFIPIIQFDPNDLSHSRVSIIINTDSLSTADSDVTDALKTSEWFDVKTYPTATFETSQFTKHSVNTYQSKGTLTIKNIHRPAILTFILDEYSNTQARVHGNTVLKRTDFRIGKGEWTKTDVLKDEVEVTFHLTALSKK